MYDENVSKHTDCPRMGEDSEHVGICKQLVTYVPKYLFLDWEKENRTFTRYYLGLSYLSLA